MRIFSYLIKETQIWWNFSEEIMLAALQSFLIDIRKQVSEHNNNNNVSTDRSN